MAQNKQSGDMKAIPAELEAKIDEIKSWMLDGDQRRVSRKARRDEGWVSRVLNKKCPPDKRILEAAIEVMNENKARFELKTA